MNDLGVSSYGLSMSTLEEVFLWVEREGTEEHNLNKNKIKPKDVDYETPKTPSDN